MRFDLLQSISLAGDIAVANDDRTGSSDVLAWVIDGATDLGESGLVGSRGGAAWLALEADAAFAAAGDASIDAICKGVFARLARRFAAQRTRAPIAAWELPSASFLAARVGKDGLACRWLGDCAGLLKRGDTVERIGPPASKDDENASAAALAEHGLGLKQRPQPILDALRRSRGRVGRYALGVDPAAVEHLGGAVLPCAAGDELLLMSDGFAALVDVYTACDLDGLFGELATLGLAGLALRLREIEQADADFTRFPRFKRSDDATALWLRIAA
ncbi:MAG: protein phosphatase 2C domain-containing protein [Sphingomonas sp.]|jgi:hypothetical protein|uniref:protein phosphatase 2C domain-containing protein n=1 Tax=Sphingomonas sp. TaxID=28214 RepID=UPI003561CD89